MLVKFDFSSKTGIIVVKFAFATANLKIETLGMRRRFARVLPVAEVSSASRAGNKNHAGQGHPMLCRIKIGIKSTLNQKADS